MRPIRALCRAVLRLSQAEGATAAVEFALILPLMLTLYIGSMELSEIITIDRRVTVVSGSVGDLVARTNGELPQSLLTDYFSAGENIMAPYTDTGLKQVVTSLFVNGNTGVATVQWSQGFNGGTAKAANSVYALPAEMTAIARGGYLIVSEAAYSHTPLLGIFFEEPFDLYRQNFYVPRFGEAITVDPNA